MLLKRNSLPSITFKHNETVINFELLSLELLIKFLENLLGKYLLRI